MFIQKLGQPRFQDHFGFGNHLVPDDNGYAVDHVLRRDPGTERQQSRRYLISARLPDGKRELKVADGPRRRISLAIPGRFWMWFLKASIIPYHGVVPIAKRSAVDLGTRDCEGGTSNGRGVSVRHCTGHLIWPIPTNFAR